MKKLFFLFFASLLFTKKINAQGCSDAGICTLANRYVNEPTTQAHQEFDLQYTYATHGQSQRFYQPQINYRYVQKSGSFFELRLPFNAAKDKAIGFTNAGIGDAIVTYNNFLGKKHKLNYTVGARVSFTDAGKSFSPPYYFDYFNYPNMDLENGLGTTDFVGLVNYDLGKYVTIGTGFQIPIIQYNSNKSIIQPLMLISPVPPLTRDIKGSDFRRQPDALIKLSSHYKLSKWNFEGGLTAIFHLGEDYYITAEGVLSNIFINHYTLTGSKGTTINYHINIGYSFSKNLSASLLVAQPLKTRSNIPDGLARSLVVTPKLTCSL